MGGETRPTTEALLKELRLFWTGIRSVIVITLLTHTTTNVAVFVHEESLLWLEGIDDCLDYRKGNQGDKRAYEDLHGRPPFHGDAARIKK